MEIVPGTIELRNGNILAYAKVDLIQDPAAGTGSAWGGVIECAANLPVECGGPHNLTLEDGRSGPIEILYTAQVANRCLALFRSAGELQPAAAEAVLSATPE